MFAAIVPRWVRGDAIQTAARIAHKEANEELICPVVAVKDTLHVLVLLALHAVGYIKEAKTDRFCPEEMQVFVINGLQICILTRYYFPKQTFWIEENLQINVTLGTCARRTFALMWFASVLLSHGW